ncbi:MAG: hypothetical protein IJ352_10270 [Muribaculaceae bacterium]|nr:hypothetical protein [Muribaculaceae bacterium]
MIKRLLFILIAFVSFTTAVAQTAVGNWKVYSMFSDIKKMEQSHNKVYYLSGTNLFSFDKETEETYSYTLKNKLNDITVDNIYYNNEKNYLLITYSSGNIDLLYDDGTVVNLPDIKNSTLNYSLEINDVAFLGDCIYVATKFGLIVFDETRHEVKYSGVYDKEISLVACVGDYIVIDQNRALYYIHKDDRFETFDSYTNIAKGNYLDDMQGISDNKMLVRLTSKNINLYTIDFSLNKINSTSVDVTKTASNFINGKEEVYFVSNNTVNSVSSDGVKTSHSSIPAELSSQIVSIWDDPDKLWVGNKDGIANYDVSDNGLTVLYDKFKPQALNVDYPVFITSDKNGKIYVSNMSESMYYDFTYRNKSFISSIDKDEIKDVAPTEFTASHRSNPSKEILYDTYQLAVDPEDPEIYYVGSFWEGLYKVKDGKTIAQYNPENSSLTESWGCRVNAVAFDKENNLWCTNEIVAEGLPSLHILPAEARKKETTTVQDWIPITLGSFYSSKDVRLLMCKKSNMIFICDGKWIGYVVAYDTNGTYTDTSDDKFMMWNKFIDQDGKNYSYNRVSALAEDKNGKVWIGTTSGIIEISNPKNATNTSLTVTRLKVPRNDGTNYADYLLDGVHVTSISVDNSNRKWIGTMSDGVYLVNENGTEILEHFTSENSYLPGGITYSVLAHPHNNSVFMGTEFGLVEYSSDSSPAKEDYSEIYAYPNPVKPEYTGLITITGLMDNSLIKIADSAGNVFYSSRSEGGMVTWDGCNSAGERVKSGVYFVYVSQNENEQSSGAVTKIMIIN